MYTKIKNKTLGTKKSIAIITPGGDAPGMNAAIRAVVRSALDRNMEIWGIMRGYDGLLEKDFIRLYARSVSGILHHGGTILKSSRSSEIRNEEAIKRAAYILKEKDIHALIVIGGDGSIHAAHRISRYGVGVVGVPASIDNDIYGTDETIGYDTTLDTVVDAVDKIRDTASSFDRIFVVEVMGRSHGYLALDAALACGAEFVVIPEIKISLQRLAAEIKKERSRAKTSVIIIFAEGAGSSAEFATRLSKLSGYETRVSTLGYIQRGGAPTGRTRILAARFAERAIELVRTNRLNRLIGIKNGQITDIPISDIINRTKPIDLKLYKLIERLGR
jgi:6-phosphofructokinase 1